MAKEDTKQVKEEDHHEVYDFPRFDGSYIMYSDLYRFNPLAALCFSSDGSISTRVYFDIIIIISLQTLSNYIIWLLLL